MSTLSLEEFSNDSFFVGETLAKQKVLFGEGITSTVGHHASLLGNHALLVSDKGIQAAGHVEKVKRIIEDSGTKVTVFVESIENPTESSVFKCVQVCLSVFKYVHMCSYVFNGVNVICSDIFKCVQLYSNVFNSIQMCSIVFKCVQLYSNVFNTC